MIYLASPYSHRHKKVLISREKAVSLAGAVLSARHKKPLFLPITTSHRMKQLAPSLLKTTFEFWAAIDYAAITVCEELWVLCIDGWKESIGVTAEIEFALKKMAIPVRYINPKTLRFINRPRR